MLCSLSLLVRLAQTARAHAQPSTARQRTRMLHRPHSAHMVSARRRAPAPATACPRREFYDSHPQTAGWARCSTVSRSSSSVVKSSVAALSAQRGLSSRS